MINNLNFKRNLMYVINLLLLDYPSIDTCIWVILSKSAQILSCNLRGYFIRFYNIKSLIFSKNTFFYKNKTQITRISYSDSMKEGYLLPRRLHVKLSTFAENHPYLDHKIQ